MTTREPLIIGPFSKGVNHFDDDSAIQDTEAVEALNFDPGLDGSLRSRPPFVSTEDPLYLGAVGHPRTLGHYYDTSGNPYMIVGDGDTTTYSYHNGAWTVITSTFSATDMQQFNGQAWLLPPVGSGADGGYWTPGGGFTSDSDMPEGTSIVSYKSRLWIAEGLGGSTPYRIRYSKVMGQPDFWDSAGFFDVAAGDGQAVVRIVTYFDSMLIFRTQSIWSYQYGLDPATAITGVLVPGIGLANKHSLVSYENYLYFMFDERAYEFINNKAAQLNIKVPFRTLNPGGTAHPYSVSVFSNRIIFSFYETLYVFSLRTRTWTTWKSDDWGPIGQLVSSFDGAEADEAFVLPSGSIPAAAVVRRNLETNPLGQPGGPLGAFIAMYSWTRSFIALPPVSFLASHAVRLTSTETGTFASRGLSSYGDPNALNPGTTSTWLDSPVVVPGETIRVSRHVRFTRSVGSTAWRMMIRFHDGAGNWKGEAQYSTYTDYVDPGQWVEVSWNGIVPDGAVNYACRVYCTDTEVTSASPATVLDITNFITENGASGEYFDATYADTDEHTFQWSGSANNSVSEMVTRRFVPLLRIRDRFTSDTENFQCVLQTKNYSFDVPGSFKILFWWGVDAIFRTNVLGQANPVVFSLSSTWGQLLGEEVTWQRVRAGTWSHPYLTDSSVSDSVSIEGSGPARKFVRFLKKLRFRQISFRVVFQVDGSNATSPVQIFTLSAYMAEKQTVSKKVS